MTTVIDLKNAKKESYAEHSVEEVLNGMGVPMSRDYRILRSVILLMCNEPALNIGDSQRLVAAQNGLTYAKVRYSMEKAIKGSTLVDSGIEVDKNGYAKVRSFVDYCIGKCRPVTD